MIRKICGIVLKFFAKNKAELLIASCVGGAVVSCISAVRDTLKALKKIKEAEQEMEVTTGDRKLTKWEVVKVSWKSFLPTIISLLLCVTCGVASATTYRKSYATLSAAASLAQAIIPEYDLFKAKTAEYLGEEKYKQLVDEVSKERKQAQLPTPKPYKQVHVHNTGRGTDRFYIGFGPQRFFSDINHVKDAVNRLNSDFHMDGRVSVNDLLDKLEIEQTDPSIGDNFGWDTVWCKNIELHLDSMVDENGYTWCVVDFYTPPRVLV